MMTPTIHINGTSRAVLLDETFEAIEAISAAMEAIAKIAPNARDYYPQGEGAFTTARDEHRVRLGRLVTLKQEYEEMADSIVGIKAECVR